MIRNTLTGAAGTRLPFAGLFFWVCLIASQAACAQLDEIVADGRLYDVNPAKTSAEEHEHAAIGIVVTAISRDEAQRQYGLLFVERNTDESVGGQAMLCPNVTVLQNNSAVAVSCAQIVGNFVEVLTVGTLNSNFCEELREDKVKGPNILSQAECETYYGGDDPQCVCYDLEHFEFDVDGGGAPPTSGSGSGGRD